MSGLELIPLLGGAAASAGAPLNLLAGTAAASGATGAAAGGLSLGQIGTALSVGGTLLGGAAQMGAAQSAADQKEQQAQTERAKAQREAFTQQKQAQLVASRQQALAGASGAGAGSDAPSIVKIMTDTAGQGAYNSAMSMWNGEERARGLEASAAADRMTGMYSFLGSGFGALGKGLNNWNKPSVPLGWDKYK